MFLCSPCSCLWMLCHSKAACGHAGMVLWARGSPPWDGQGDEPAHCLGTAGFRPPAQGELGIPPRCDRPWGRWQIPVLRHNIRFGVRSFLSKSWRAEGAVGAGCTDAAQNLSKSQFPPCQRAPGKAEAGIPLQRLNSAVRVAVLPRACVFTYIL